MKSKNINKSNIDSAQECKNEEIDRDYYNNIKNCATDLQNLSLNFFPSINTYSCIPKLNAINAITFHPCISSKDYYNNTYSFKPLFTHHFFSESEQVIGFDSLKIDFYYTCDNCEVFMKLKGCICDQYENSNHIMLMLLQNLYITTPYPGGFIETEEEFLRILNRNEKNEIVKSNKMKKNVKENIQSDIYKPPGFIIYEKEISDDVILQIRKCGFSSMYFKKENCNATTNEEKEKILYNNSQSIYDRLSKSIYFDGDTNEKSVTSNKDNDKNKNNLNKIEKNAPKVNINNENIDNNENEKIANFNKKKEENTTNKLCVDKNSCNKDLKNENFNSNNILNDSSKMYEKKNSHTDLNILSNDTSVSPIKERKKNDKTKKEIINNKDSDSDNVFAENKKLKKNCTRYITEKDMSRLYREYLHILKEKKKKGNLSKLKECESNVNNVNDNIYTNNNDECLPSENYSMNEEMGEEAKEERNNKILNENNNKYDYTIKDNFELLHRKVEWFYHWFIESASNIEYDYRWSVILPYIVFKYDNNKKFSENNFIDKLNYKISINNNFTFDFNGNIKVEKTSENNKINRECTKQGKEIIVETEKDQKRKIKEEKKTEDEKKQTKKRILIVDDEEKKQKKKKKKVKKIEDLDEEMEKKEEEQEEREKREKDSKENYELKIVNNNNTTTTTKNNNNNVNSNNNSNDKRNNNNITNFINDGKEYVLTNIVVKKAIEDTLNNLEIKKEEDYYSFHNNYDVIYLYSDLVKKNEKKKDEKKKEKREIIIEENEEEICHKEENCSYYFYLFGLATTYTFFTFQFDRNRISQFLIFPPMQNKGLGMKVLEKIYHLSIVNNNIREITVEDPAISFTQLRDIITIKICIDLKILSPTILYPDEYLKTKNIKKENIELDKKRFMKVCKETHKQITRMIETLLLASVLPHPAPIYIENDEKFSSIRKKEKKNENVNYVNSMEYFESSDLCKDVRIKIKKRIKNDYIGNLINKNMNCMASDVFRDYVKEELYKLWKKQCKVYYRTIKKLRSIYPL
ncbi:histone acetyltransferase, putative [Plasmodium gallinaceum]|uniref:histone acetyltransferase n=1 Tax=Plasmodium gallinaceum TaxID=5849 RepID=A0A1J1GLJ2_PLAGA|nr:histone acetyltransferase, putative [Plasmodium gallinaceum]CRG93195.1 histone acetyltransferase, putative [Plasmodium gallinaceum]